MGQLFLNFPYSVASACPTYGPTHNPNATAYLAGFGSRDLWMAASIDRPCGAKSSTDKQVGHLER